MDNHFKIIIPLYNVEKWIKICIRSVRAQTYKNFQCIILDDISTDNSVEVIKKEIANDDRFKLVVNENKAFALKNIYDGIQMSNPSSEDVIVTLDGDDWLAGRDVLKRLNEIYSAEKCWLTYGSYAEYPSNIRGKFAKQIPAQVIEGNSFRQHEWCSSHLRTFKYHLWNRIKKEDLLDTEGNFYKMTWDLAFMFPMLEMAGHKSKFIRDIMYVYNVDNPLNDHKVDNTYQINLEREIRAKEKYQRVSSNSSALRLLNSNRFDIAAKTLYARNKVKKTGAAFARELYLQHLKVWNNFHEKTPLKEGPGAFLNAFDQLLENIEQNDFDEQKGKIPTIHGSAINGAHRIASCIVLEKELKTYEANITEGQYLCNYQYFQNKKDFVNSGLEQEYLDEMALEFCRNKGNLYTISLFPSHTHPVADLFSNIKELGGIIYNKEIELTDAGKLNYIHNLYYNEEWIGPKGLNYPGVREKAKLCFSSGNKVNVFLVEQADPNKMALLKEKLRELCGVGKHSVHINDTQKETWRIASSVFNKNSVHLLNNRQIQNTPAFDGYFERLQDILETRQDEEDFCVDSSAVLSAYGLRDCRDMDFLHLRDVSPLDRMIDCHNPEAHHYRVDKNEIIYNPKMHFYLHGVKFASLQTVKEMKEFRDEEKDRVDVKLMDKLLQ
tara:strand:- start:1614 stop:3608 length:1995 start_codon:yes stop_codon:yes gene_type:complete